MEPVLSGEPSWEATVTSRSKPGYLRFDLGDESTWGNLRKAGDFQFTFWVFPAEPLSVVQRFISECGSHLGRILVIGSTGNYVVTDGAEVTEETAPDITEARVAGEEYLRSLGHIVVRASGLYGRGRDPRSWVERGLVGPSSKLVNFIHVDDLAQILIAAARRGRAGATYLAADGVPMRWDDLIARWQRDFQLQVPGGAPASRRASKRVNPTQTFKELGIVLKYPNVLEGIAQEAR